jgi:hypothetical protein
MVFTGILMYNKFGFNVLNGIPGDSQGYKSIYIPGIPRNTTLNQNGSNKDMDNFNSLMTTDVGGLIQCDSKRVIKIATANVVLNSEPVIVPNVLLIQIGRKEPK